MPKNSKNNPIPPTSNRMYHFTGGLGRRKQAEKKNTAPIKMGK